MLKDPSNEYYLFRYKNERDSVSMKVENCSQTLSEVLETFKKFLLSMGFHPDNVRDVVDVSHYGYNFNPKEGFLVEIDESTEDAG